MIYFEIYSDLFFYVDIVILRAWYPILPRKMYNPVTSLLIKDKTEWKGMRLTGQVRYENEIAVPNPKDSQYKTIERSVRHFNPLRVPKAIRTELPFKSQIAMMRPQKKDSYLAKRAVVLDGEEKKKRDLLQKVMTLRNEKDRKRQEKKLERKAVFEKKLADNEQKRREREKKDKKEYFSKYGKKRGADGAGGRSGKRRRGGGDDFDD